MNNSLYQTNFFISESHEDKNKYTYVINQYLRKCKTGMDAEINAIDFHQN